MAKIVEVPDGYQRVPFEFRGTAREFFGIWLINTLFSVITLGIYSPWAKVRTARYFHGNCYLGDHSFDYHATGRQLLVGRAIAVVLYLGFFLGYERVLAWNFSAGIALLVAFSVLVPWFVVLSLRFRARMSSYRNVGFSFDGGFKTAVWVWFFAPLIAWGVAIALAAAPIVFEIGVEWPPTKEPSDQTVLLALGIFVFALLLLLPLVQRWDSQFLTRAHKFADLGIKLDVGYRTLFVAYFAYGIFAVLFVGSALVAIGVVAYLALDAVGIDLSNPVTGWGVFSQLIVGYLVIFLVVIPSFGFLNTMVRNRVWNRASLRSGDVRLRSTINPVAFVWITVTNALATLLTLGLLRPWAMVRKARYLASRSAIDLRTGADPFSGPIYARGRASAAEFADMEGIDMGLGL